MIDVMTLRAACSAFWRKGRKTYVPLTCDEIKRGMGKQACHISLLLNAGIVKAEKTSGSTLRTYEITELGKRLHKASTANGRAALKEGKA